MPSGGSAEGMSVEGAGSPPEAEPPQPAERLRAFTAAFDAVTQRMRTLRCSAQPSSRCATVRLTVN